MTVRIAVLIIGLILGTLMSLEVLDTLSTAMTAVEFGIVAAEPMQNGAAAGLLVMLGWLIGVAFAYPNPNVARFGFGLGSFAAWCIAVLTPFDSMWFWAVVGLFITTLCAVSVREKEKADAKEALHEQFIRQQLGLPQTSVGYQPLTSHEVNRQAARPTWLTDDQKRL